MPDGNYSAEGTAAGAAIGTAFAPGVGTMIGGALGGLAGGLFGGGDSKAERLNMQAYLEGKQEARMDRRRTNEFYDQARAILGQYLNQGLASLDRGIADAGLAFRGQRQAIRDTGRQRVSATDQSLARRGLYNTTALDSARRGANAQTTRDLNNLAAQEGALMGQLGMQRAGFLSNTGGALASLIQNQSAANQRSTGMLMNTINGTTFTQRPDTTATDLGAALGALGGLAFSGAFGGPSGTGGQSTINTGYGSQFDQLAMLG